MRARSLFRPLIWVLAGGAVSAQAPIFGVLDGPIPLAGFPVEAVGDLDADGDADLLGQHAVSLNDGHGRFVPVSSNLTFPCWRPLIADLNNDGLRDVASIDGSGVPSVVRIEYNLGGLVFSGPVAGLPIIPQNAWGLAVGDVDSDGDLDLLIGTITGTYPWWYGPGPIHLWLNMGGGAFVTAPASAFPSISYGAAPILEDFDGDGDLDALVDLSIAVNNGGVFSPLAAPVWTAPPGAPYGVEVGRFNSDALPDLIIGYGSLAGPGVDILLNSTTGFLPPVTTNMYLGAVVTVDVNGDGIDDIVHQSNPYGGVSAHVVSPGGAIGPATQTWRDLFVITARGKDVAQDLDADLDRDLVVNGWTGPVELMNAGNGTLARLGGHVSELALSNGQQVGDVDGDGDPDIVGLIFQAEAIGSALNDGDGFFTATSMAVPLASAGGAFYALHLFDRDGDGDGDLYAALRGSLGGSGDLVYDNIGGAFVQIATVSGTGSTSVMKSADFDGDGDQDLLLGRRIPTAIGSPSPGPMLALVNLGAAGLSQPIAIGGNHATYDLDLGDFDGNGWMDVFQTNKDLQPGGVDECVVYLNIGGGTYVSVVQTGLSGFFTAAGDLNADGMTDLVVDGQVYMSAGGGSFAAGPMLTSALAAPATLVDADEDGDLDIIETPGTVMRNAGAALFGARELYLPPFAVASPAFWNIIESAVADVDRDGDPDIVSPGLNLAGNAQGPIVLENLTRQIARGSVPRPGRPASIDLFGTPGGAWVLFASSGTAALTIPPLGNVLVDPATALPFASGVHAPAGTTTAGTSSVTAVTPNVPGLVGWTTYWQALDVATLKVTNRSTVTVLGF